MYNMSSLVAINPIMSQSGFYPVGGGAGGKLIPKLPSFPPNVACCEPYIALNCISGDLKFKIFWGKTPRPPLAHV